MSAPQLLITIGRVDVGVGLQGEKQRDSERRREETRAKQLSAAEKPTGMEKFSVADEAGEDGRISEVGKILGSKTQKPFLDLWAEEETKRSPPAEDTHHLLHAQCIWHRTKSKATCKIFP